MAVLTLPSIIPNSSEFGLISNTQTFTSPLSGIVQTLELPGAKWHFTNQYNNLSEAETRIVSAFLASLRGQAGRFYSYDHSHPEPSGIATGTPQVNGAAQTGATLLTKGWSNDITGILLAGDYIGIGNELKLVTADADSNGSGLATLLIEPPIRNSPADSSSIVTSTPTCIMRLTESGYRKSSRPPYLSNITISGIEAFTA